MENISNSFIWENEYLNAEGIAIFRKGQYACVIDQYFESDRTFHLIDLKINQKMKTIICKKNESITDFDYPYLVIRQNSTFKIWNAESRSSEPYKVINTNLTGIHKGVLKGKTLVILSDKKKSMVPKYITIFEDIDNPEATKEELKDNSMDVYCCPPVICGNELLYSRNFGNIACVDWKNSESVKYLHLEKDLEKYLENLNELTLEEYEKNIVKSLIKDGNTLVGCTEKVLKIWNISSSSLIKEIPIEEKYDLINLEDRILMGYCSYKVMIWDIFSGIVLYSEKNRSPLRIPSFTVYQNRIIRVTHNTKEEFDNVIINLPLKN